jgi:formate hydrogenlyase transcriptional activator
LRERREDIPLLVEHFVGLFSSRIGKAVHDIPAETMRALVSYSWPGNIRELQNVIERAVIQSRGPVLTADIPELNVGVGRKCSEPKCGSLDHVLHETERTQILRALELANGVVAGPRGAAARLSVKRSTLLSRMQKLGIRTSRSWIALPEVQRDIVGAAAM